MQTSKKTVEQKILKRENINAKYKEKFSPSSGCKFKTQIREKQGAFHSLAQFTKGLI